MKKYNLKIDTMKESELKKVYKYPIYPRDSKKISDRGFVNIDNGSMGASHWTCFIVKDDKSFHFDSFGVTPDNLLLNQLSKPILYHNHKIQVITSKLGGSYCLYFSFSIESMNFYHTIILLAIVCHTDIIRQNPRSLVTSFLTGFPPVSFSLILLLRYASSVSKLVHFFIISYVNITEYVCLF